MVTLVRGGAGFVFLAAMLVGCSTLPRSYVIVMPNPDGSVGTVILKGESGERTVNQAAKATGFNRNRKQVDLKGEQIHRTFWQVLTGAPPDPVRFILYFDRNQVLPNRMSSKTWDDLLITVHKWPAPEIVIDGFTDRRAADEYNMKLSDQRAEWISSSVIHAGVDPARVHLRAFGEQSPAVPTADGVAEPLNRRVEISIR